MILPEKMKIINASFSNDSINEQLNALPLNDEYVVIFRTEGDLSFNELLPFAEKLGKPLIYNEKNYITYDKVHLECEMHYDGISSDGVRAMPDWLIFYMGSTSKEKGGEFRLLNCESVLDDLCDELVEFLENTPLDIYGFKHLADPTPEPYKFSFSIQNIVTENGKKILRMHIPTHDNKQIDIEPEYVHCKIDDFRIRFRGKSGVESAEIFRKIREAAYLEKNILEISLKEGDIVFVKNRFVFHGRNGCVSPTSRLMHRIQLVNY